MVRDSLDGIVKTSDGCQLAYTLHPSPASGAPRIVLIHSLALDQSMWNGVVSELVSSAEVLTYDCRGHGASRHPATTYSADLFARDLAELLNHLGWPGAAIAGCSMGGCVAQAFAGMYPDRTQGLALVDTTAWYGPEAWMQWRERAAAAREKGLGGLVDFQITRWFSDQFRSSHPEVGNALIKVFLANDIDCYAAACEMLGDADLRRYLPTFRMPVSVIVGEEDYATPIGMARELHAAIPQSTFTVIAGGRHLTPVERPKEIARLLATVVGQSGGRRAGIAGGRDS